MPNDDYIPRSDALKAILGVSIYDTIEELEGARTIAENTWADGLYDAYKIIEEEVDAANVEPVRKWIPVTERLPENDDHVLCCTETKAGRKNIVIGYWMDGMWRCGMNSNVTVWMPLPDPPKEGRNESE